MRAVTAMVRALLGALLGPLLRAPSLKVLATLELPRGLCGLAAFTSLSSLLTNFPMVHPQNLFPPRHHQVFVAPRLCRRHREHLEGWGHEMLRRAGLRPLETNTLRILGSMNKDKLILSS